MTERQERKWIVLVELKVVGQLSNCKGGKWQKIVLWGNHGYVERVCVLFSGPNLKWQRSHAERAE